jgi:hypothetical protein
MTCWIYILPLLPKELNFSLSVPIFALENHRGKPTGGYSEIKEEKCWKIFGEEKKC